jgi:hypothetical protein
MVISAFFFLSAAGAPISAWKLVKILLGKKGKLEIPGNYYIMPEGKISRIGKKILPHQFYTKRRNKYV